MGGRTHRIRLSLTFGLWPRNRWLRRRTRDRITGWVCCSMSGVTPSIQHWVSETSSTGSALVSVCLLNPQPHQSVAQLTVEPAKQQQERLSQDIEAPNYRTIRVVTTNHSELRDHGTVPEWSSSLITEYAPQGSQQQQWNCMNCHEC